MAQGVDGVGVEGIEEAYRFFEGGGEEPEEEAPATAPTAEAEPAAEATPAEAPPAAEAAPAGAGTPPAAQ